MRRNHIGAAIVIILLKEIVVCKVENHLPIHTGEKLYHFSHFDMSFSENSVLLSHKLLCTGENPYQCSHCDKTFLRKAV